MQQLILLLLLLPLSILECDSQSTSPSVRHEMARPVRRRIDSPSRAKEIDFFTFEFQRPYLGFEGPNFTRLAEEPSAGARYLVRADLFRQEAVATAKFELVDSGGRLIGLPHLSKRNTYLDDGNYDGFVKVPTQPFRVAVSGKDIYGQPYRRVYKRLIRPMNRPPAPPLLPSGYSPAEANAIRLGLEALEQETIANIEKEVSKNPDGVIVMPRVETSNVTYEPLLSEKGNPLGVRLRYDILFSTDGNYAHSLHMSPSYEVADFLGLVAMEVINEKIDPRPEPPSYATPDIHVDMNTLVKDGSEGWFKGGVIYHFVVDLTPDFVGQNASKTKFCVDEEHYKIKVKSQQVWEAMKARSTPIKWRVFINRIDYAGETELFYPPRIFYDGFLREGAVKCKPDKNTNF
jgi:hypothetical protein